MIYGIMVTLTCENLSIEIIAFGHTSYCILHYSCSMMTLITRNINLCDITLCGHDNYTLAMYCS